MISVNVGSFTTSHTYTYDTKNNPFMNVTGFDKIGFIDSEANSLHHNTLTDTYNNFSGNTIYTSTYTYNSLNFPVTASEIEGTEASTIITTQFTYN